MSTRRWLINRRTMLRGIGVTMALPLLNVMTPAKSSGADYKVTLPKMPVRYAALYVPNGLIPTPQGKEQNKWTPLNDGKLADKLPELLSPFESVKEKIIVLSGLHNALARGHQPSPTGFLCSTKANTKGLGNIDSGGPSIDQVMASCLGQFTKLPSLELALDAPEKGLAQTGDNNLYGGYLSWKSRASPIDAEIDPKAAFNRLFRSYEQKNTNATIPNSIADDQSVLDAVIGNLSSFTQTLGIEDRRKLEEYTTSVRELEQRLERERKNSKAPRSIDPAAIRALPNLDKQVHEIGDMGSRSDTQKIMRSMLDIMVLAFWTDTTRVATFLMGREVGRRNFSFLNGVKGSHHQISHHENNKEIVEQYIKISVWHMEQCAYLVQRLGQIKEGNSTLLDNSMLMMGAGIRDGNKHDNANLPIILAGGGGGTLKGGRHVTANLGTPLANLHVETARRMGIQMTQFADSNGSIRGL